MITNADGYFFDREVGLPQELRRLIQPFVHKKMAQVHAHLKFE